MIREFQFADWFTLANAVCGTGAVLTSMTYLQTGDVSRIYMASGAILAALIFDVLDGRVARWRQSSSPMGRELPTSIVLVAMLALAVWTGAVGDGLWLGETEVAGFRLHWLTLLYAASGSLMISRIRIPKL